MFKVRTCTPEIRDSLSPGATEQREKGPEKPNVDNQGIKMVDPAGFEPATKGL